MEKCKLSPSQKIELQKWKMIKQQYINKLSNYLPSGFTLVPHDKDILVKAEKEVAILECRKPLTFDEMKNKIIIKLKKKIIPKQ